MGRFSDLAPRYWAIGKPVMPCVGKRPVITGWQRLGREMPTLDEQRGWVVQYADHNIGLPLGPQSELAVVDIDTDDPTEIAAIRETLPFTPFERVGKKGVALFYKWDDRLKNFSVPGKVDFLAEGRQVILPPSVHPETGLPYKWTGEGLC